MSNARQGGFRGQLPHVVHDADLVLDVRDATLTSFDLRPRLTHACAPLSRSSRRPHYRGGAA